MTTALVPIERSLPHLEPLRLLRAQVLNTVAAENSRRNYGKALDEFFAFWIAKSELLSRALVMQYRAQLLEMQLAPPTINVRLSAVRKLVSEVRRNGWSQEGRRGRVAKVASSLRAPAAAPRSSAPASGWQHTTRPSVTTSAFHDERQTSSRPKS